MLLIAISYGQSSDPFTTSTVVKDSEAALQGLDYTNANQMRHLICEEKGLQPHWIDEILIVYPSDYDEEPEVQHHHTEFD